MTDSKEIKKIDVNQMQEKQPTLGLTEHELLSANVELLPNISNAKIIAGLQGNNSVNDFLAISQVLLSQAQELRRNPANIELLLANQGTCTK